MLSTTLRRLREARAAEVSGEGAAEGGFTLIELMVVLLIIAILLAIAIPTFLGVTSSANDRAAQSNLTNALTEASAVYQNSGQTFSNGVSALFTSSAPEFSWTSGGCGTSPQNCVSYDVFSVGTGSGTNADGNGLLLADRSNVGDCWYTLDILNAPSNPVVTGAAVHNLNETNAGAYYAHSSAGTATNANCTASDPIADANGWGANETWYTSYSSATTAY
jgi:type IV pilus assembly protein PilA